MYLDKKCYTLREEKNPYFETAGGTTIQENVERKCSFLFFNSSDAKFFKTAAFLPQKLLQEVLLSTSLFYNVSLFCASHSSICIIVKSL